MTNKAKFGLALVALNRLDIMWDTNPSEVTVSVNDSVGYRVIVRVRVACTLTRHTDALNTALEQIMDTELGRNFKIPPDVSL